MQTTPSRRRGEAWAYAKLAIRAYSRNPSAETEIQVQEACLALRRTSLRVPEALAEPARGPEPAPGLVKPEPARG